MDVSGPGCSPQNEEPKSPVGIFNSSCGLVGVTFGSAPEGGEVGGRTVGDTSNLCGSFNCPSDSVSSLLYHPRIIATSVQHPYLEVHKPVTSKCAGLTRQVETCSGLWGEERDHAWVWCGVGDDSQVAGMVRDVEFGGEVGGRGGAEMYAVEPHVDGRGGGVCADGGNVGLVTGELPGGELVAPSPGADVCVFCTGRCHGHGELLCVPHDVTIE
mmetsp:Transcript_46076/g.108599  ORF Transcript_46076/g.108599 Transcript_46076/m.108599 type:complete len:214 (-) Transcript_46076:1237-1878(-)